MERQRIAECMAVVAAYWPNVTTSWEKAGADMGPDFMFNTWAYELGDLPAEAVITAIRQLANSDREFAPPLGVIAAAARELVAPDPYPTPDEAWGVVTKAIKAVGSYRREWGEAFWTEDGDPGKKLIGRIADNMGWMELCMSENQMADRAHFIKFYEAAVTKARREAAIPPEMRDLLRGIGKQLPGGEGV